MSPLFRKKSSALDKRIQRIQEEADRVDHDLRLLSKFVEKPTRSTDLSKLKSVTFEPARSPASPAAVRRGPAVPGRMSLPPPLSAGPVPATMSPETVSDPRSEPRGYRGGKAGAYDERFADYLASSFHASRPLRQERRIQRNKVVVMTIIVAMLLIWALSRFGLL